MTARFIALIIILAGLACTSLLAKPLLTQLGIDPRAHHRRVTVYALLTTASLLSPDFWVYAAVATATVFVSGKREKNPLALYLMVLMAVLPVGRELPTFGIVGSLLQVNHKLILALFLLLPTLLQHRRNVPAKDIPNDGLMIWSMLAFCTINNIQSLQNFTLTGLLRDLINTGIEFIIPYMVATRTIKTPAELRECLVYFIFSLATLALVAIPETLLHWPFFNTAMEALNLSNGMQWSLERDGQHRAQGSAGSPIVFGYVLAVGLGLWPYVSRPLNSTHAKALTTLTLGLGLFLTLSRGPWVGAVAVLAAHLVVSPEGRKQVAKYLPLIGVALAATVVTPYGPRLWRLLPFTADNVDTGSMEYRSALFELGIRVLKDSPFFGDPRFASQLEALRQGQGIIDLVNTYLYIALPTGLVGLTLWLLPTLTALHFSAREAFKPSRTASSPDLQALSVAMFSALVGMCVTFATVSPIGVTTAVLTIMVGLTINMERLIREEGRVRRSAKFNSTH